MKFFSDLLITFTGLVLLVSILITLFAVIGYFQGDSTGDILGVLKFTIPLLLATSLIGWWKRNVFWAMFEWAFPTS